MLYAQKGLARGSKVIYDAVAKKSVKAVVEKPVPMVSVIGYFHRAGNMEFWVPPAERIPATLPERKIVSSSRRSL